MSKRVINANDSSVFDPASICRRLQKAVRDAIVPLYPGPCIDSNAYTYLHRVCMTVPEQALYYNNLIREHFLHPEVVVDRSVVHLGANNKTTRITRGGQSMAIDILVKSWLKEKPHCRVIVILVFLVRGDGKASHANLAIFDVMKRMWYRFEPHGGMTRWSRDPSAHFTDDKFWTALRIKDAWVHTERRPIQGKNKLCLLWTVDFARFLIKHVSKDNGFVESAFSLYYHGAPCTHSERISNLAMRLKNKPKSSPNASRSDSSSRSTSSKLSNSTSNNKKVSTRSKSGFVRK